MLSKNVHTPATEKSVVKKPLGVNHLTYPEERTRLKTQARNADRGAVPRAVTPGAAAKRKQQLDAAEPVKTGTNGMRKIRGTNRNTCKVTFRLPQEAVRDAQSVCVAGEFNNWSIYANPLKRRKDGSFSVTIELVKGREYQFRYLIDDMYWENDWAADKYVSSAFGDCDNSVVIV
jgi:hypothetical protein